MRCFVWLVLVVTARTAFAGTPRHDDDDDIDWRDDRAFLEWSTWLRFGVGVERNPREDVPRTTLPTSRHEQAMLFDPALGIDATLPFPTRKVRIGPWLELRPQGVFGGGELTIAGGDFDMFCYPGERVWAMRAGSSMTHVTGALAFGYRVPWRLWGPYDGATRYMIGVRLVASATRAVADADDWSMSLGLEFEPAGAFRYVAGFGDWY